MNAVIIGQKWLAAELLVRTYKKLNIKRVITPDSDNQLYSRALSLGVPVTIESGTIKSEHIPSGTDLIICAHSHNFVSKAARESAKLGAIGYHPSLLPRHRGKNAIVCTIKSQDAIAGGTVYWLNDIMDSGPIELQDWCHVYPSDTPQSLWKRNLAPLGIDLLERTIERVLLGRSDPREQDELLASQCA